MTSKDKTKVDNTYFWWSIAVAAVAIAFATHSRLPSWDVPASTKPYRSLLEFYPYYLSEHRNYISRGMHVYGTTLVLFLMGIKYKQQTPNFLIGFSVGMMLCELLAPLQQQQGWIEFAFLLLIPFILAKARQQELPIWVPVTGYFYAWVGHFMFEKNQPATFVYPSYSLLCDFVMWFHTVTGKLPATRTLDTELIDQMKKLTVGV